MTLVPIAEYPDRIAADVARIGLATEGIEALLFDGGMADLGLGFMTPVRLMVHEDDAQRARDLIESA